MSHAISCSIELPLHGPFFIQLGFSSVLSLYKFSGYRNEVGRSMPRRFLLSFLTFGLLALVAAFAVPASAQTPQPEKRVALVVGNGNYAKEPLATAANDAGLIAQTLQAAGFDVIGARDLDGDTLRKSFRDFIKAAEASPSDTVAMIYLAGYGIQLAGENYFIPVDSAIGGDADIPIEGMRISDYTRQLASLRLKASVLVLDAARQQPFIRGGEPIAGGLALVEPGQNMLIAFNAAPGTVAPGEPGPYGIYAQSLAEMIRTGGLSLPEVFDRVRLRVSEKSKGAQIPWDAQKLQSTFTFFDRAPDAPAAQGTPDQVAAFRDRPIRDLGAQDAFTAAIERDSVQGYEDFLSAYASDPLAKRVRAILAARREAVTWRRTYLADTPDAYWSYLRRYPRGPHAADARRRLSILTAPIEPPPSFAMLEYDVPPPPPDEIVYVDRPVLYFGDPDFGFEPAPPPPLYYLPPPPPDFVVLAPPFVAVGLFILPRPVFVPIPVFVRPPAHVTPPPNNIVFGNIHNTTVINTVINQPTPAPNSPTAAAARAGTAGPTLPPAVAQRASLIQQGKLPVPPSASINPAARPGAPGVLPANVAPSALPGTGQGVPRANTLPIPGIKGAPPPPPGARLAPPHGAPPPGVSRSVPPETAPTGPGGPGRANPALVPLKPPVAQTTPTTRPEERGRQPAPPPAPPSFVKPATSVAKPAVAPPPPSRPQMTRPTSPPMRAAPLAPRPQMARPAPPPVRAAPPPPRMAAPAMRPPPAMARPAPPPPTPRPAAPPPRPAAPAAKRCPSNAPRC
jgi:uncharacterized caspase-like protein